jgi:hypothetical protein
VSFPAFSFMSNAIAHGAQRQGGLPNPVAWKNLTRAQARGFINQEKS